MEETAKYVNDNIWPDQQKDKFIFQMVQKIHDLFENEKCWVGTYRNIHLKRRAEISEGEVFIPIRFLPLLIKEKKTKQKKNKQT